MNSPEEDEDRLRTLLQEWKIDEPLPLGFQDQVWRRIDRFEPLRERLLVRLQSQVVRIASLLPRPAFAIACTLSLFAAGATAGWIHARNETARVSTELSARYAQSVNPYTLIPPP